MSNLYKVISKRCPLSQNIVVKQVSGKNIGASLMLADGEIVFTTGGQDFQKMCQEIATDIKESGMIEKNGEKLFCEIAGSPKKLVICGGGHVCMPMISIGKMLGFHVTVLEDRISFADKAKMQGADEVFCTSFEEGLQEIPGDKDTFFVIVTRGHRYDQRCLSVIAEKAHAYIGMIGSRSRAKKVKEALEGEGIPLDILERVHTPIGLDIRAETPEEIAVAVMAEIIEVKNNKKRSGGYSTELLEQIQKNRINGMASILATIVARKGSAPRETGTKMLINRDGKITGTIGGGCVEADLFQRALIMAQKERSQPELCHIDMTGRNAEEEGMVCGGAIDVFLERIS